MVQKNNIITSNWAKGGLNSKCPGKLLTFPISELARVFLSLHCAFCSLFHYTHQHMHIYILFKKSKIYIKHLNAPTCFDHTITMYVLSDDRLIETCRSVLNVLM